MKISIDPTAGTLISVKTKDGKTFKEDQIASIEIEPYFRTAVEVATVAKLTAKTAQGREVEACLLCVSGSSGKITRREQSNERVTPAIDTQTPETEEPQAEPETKTA